MVSGPEPPVYFAEARFLSSPLFCHFDRNSWHVLDGVLPFETPQHGSLHDCRRCCSTASYRYHHRCFSHYHYHILPLVTSAAATNSATTNATTATSATMTMTMTMTTSITITITTTTTTTSVTTLTTVPPPAAVCLEGYS